MEQNNRKNLKKYLDLVMLGDKILKNHGWNKDGNNTYSSGSPSNEEYAGYLNSCISMIRDTLGNDSTSYLMVKKLIDNDKTSKYSYYFADCFGIVKTAYEIYNEKILSENKLDILLENIEKLYNISGCFNDTTIYDTDFRLWYKDFKNIFETYEFGNEVPERVFNNLKFKFVDRNERYEGLTDKQSFDQDVGICRFYLEKMKQDINTYGEKAVKIKEQNKIDEKNITTKINQKNNKRCLIIEKNNCNEDILEIDNWIFQAYNYKDKKTEKIINENINKVLSQHNIIPKPAKDYKKNKDYLCKICQFIKKSKYFFADISTRNENVAYEIGLASGLGKKIVIISRRNPDEFSDLKRQDIILYKFDNTGDLKYEFNKALVELLN